MMIPSVSKDLLDCLALVFPNKLPVLDTSAEQLSALQGEQNVIRFLQHQYTQQQKNLLKGNP